jgi:hypothetical protein
MKFHAVLGTALLTIALFLTSTTSQALTVRAIEWTGQRVVFDVQWGPQPTDPTGDVDYYFDWFSAYFVAARDFGHQLRLRVNIEYYGEVADFLFTFADTQRLPGTATYTQLPPPWENPIDCEDCEILYDEWTWAKLEGSAAVYPGGRKVPGPKGLPLDRHGARFVLGEDYEGFAVPDAGSTLVALTLALGALTTASHLRRSRHFLPSALLTPSPRPAGRGPG